MTKEKKVTLTEEELIEQYRKELAEVFKNVSIKDQEEMTAEELNESFDD